MKANYYNIKKKKKKISSYWREIYFFKKNPRTAKWLMKADYYNLKKKKYTIELFIKHSC